MRLPKPIRTLALKIQHRSTLKRFVRLHAALSRRLNTDYYLTANPDVRGDGVDPVLHFIRIGWRENRRVSINDDARSFLSHHEDVAAELAALDALDRPERLDGLFRASIPRRTAPSTRPGEADPERARTVLFVGYVEAGLGLGEVLRNTIRCYRSIADDFSIHPIGRHVGNRFIGRFMPDFYDREHAHRVNVFEMTTDQVAEILADVGRERTEHAYNVIKLYWELPEIPDEVARKLALFDEVWVPSRFVQSAVEAVFDGPVAYVPPSIDVATGNRQTREDFGLSPDTFYFLCSFDYNSALERKNPQAVVRAFTAAFPKSEGSVGLIIKSNRPEDDTARAAFMGLLDELQDPRIVVIDRFLDRSAMLSLIAGCDAYVSLHRSEGFGLGMAEALALGRPVVATDYSANQDFLTEENGYPVGYRLVPVAGEIYLHGAGQSWADPIHEEAVSALKRAYQENRAGGTGTRRRFSTDLFERERVAHTMKARIDAILAGR